MQIAVCDDDPLSLQAVLGFAEAWKRRDPQREQTIRIHPFHSSEELLAQWNKGTVFDILFLDIRIPNEMSGLEVARRIRTNNDQAVIVFTTDYSEFVYAGYEVDALRYLRKPVAAGQVEECLNIAYGRWLLTKDQTLLIGSGGQEKTLLPHREILYMESQGHYTKIWDIYGKEYRFRIGISDLMKKLPEDLFVLCHRSYIVNLMHIRKLTRNTVTLSDGHEVPVGAGQRSNLENRFMTWYQGAVI